MFKPFIDDVNICMWCSSWCSHSCRLQVHEWCGIIVLEGQQLWLPRSYLRQQSKLCFDMSWSLATSCRHRTKSWLETYELWSIRTWLHFPDLRFLVSMKLWGLQVLWTRRKTFVFFVAATAVGQRQTCFSLSRESPVSGDLPSLLQLALDLRTVLCVLVQTVVSTRFYEYVLFDTICLVKLWSCLHTCFDLECMIFTIYS